MVLNNASANNRSWLVIGMFQVDLLGKRGRGLLGSISRHSDRGVRPPWSQLQSGQTVRILGNRDEIIPL